MEEIETEVSDFDDTHNILLSIGLIPYLDYNKKRTSYKFKKILFEIDEYEYIPPCLEIEAPSIEIINEMVERLEFDKDKVKSWSGSDLLAHYGKKFTYEGNKTLKKVKMIEHELTYLAKSLPDNLKDCKSKEIIDIYIPKQSDHPTLRIRKNGDKYEMTKKEPVEGGDASHQEEQTIILTESEFNTLSKLDGKKIHKIRYLYNHDGMTAEFDVFQGPLAGLVVIDFEFDKVEDKKSFQMPDFCLAEVTHELWVAGGMICGKSYEDVEQELLRFGYKKLFMERNN
ncbi:MAG: CYTH domain-containing protein [Candidatus Woesearchaeota archaeon]